LDADKCYNASYGAYISLVILAGEYFSGLPAYWFAPVPVAASLLDKVIAREEVIVDLKDSFVDWQTQKTLNTPRQNKNRPVQ
jgi:hypothetical protein